MIDFSQLGPLTYIGRPPLPRHKRRRKKGKVGAQRTATLYGLHSRVHANKYGRARGFSGAQECARRCGARLGLPQVGL